MTKTNAEGMRSRGGAAGSRSRRRRVALTLLIAGALSGGCAQFPLAELAEIAIQSQPLDQTTVASGLKEALRVGTGRAATTLSQSGGFSQNPLLRLVLPEQLDPLAQTLRTVGFGAQVDELELAMNRAAERAAGEAVPVFATAVASMTVEDAFGILNGADDSATQYLKRTTSTELRSRFSPVVQRAMREVGLYDSYRQLMSRYEAIPFAKQLDPDLEGYVADQALAGLFSTLADEEKRIREDPSARTTALLRRVFGSNLQR